MAILGQNINGPTYVGTDVGRMVVSKFTLASASTLTELHGWFAFGGGGSDTARVVIYKSDADTAGTVGGSVGAPNVQPGTLVAYTNPLATTGGGGTAFQLGQTGFSVALAAGDYWIGFRSATSGMFVGKGDTGNYLGILSGVADPPPSVFGDTNFSASLTLSCWAVVSAAAVTPVAAFSGTPLSGDAPLNVTFTDASTNTPTSWAWDFGDTGTSSSQNPSHNYTVPGVYTVELDATNAAGTDNEAKVGYVTVLVPAEPLNYAETGGITVA